MESTHKQVVDNRRTVISTALNGLWNLLDVYAVKSSNAYSYVSAFFELSESIWWHTDEQCMHDSPSLLWWKGCAETGWCPPEYLSGEEKRFAAEIDAKRRSELLVDATEQTPARKILNAFTDAYMGNEMDRPIIFRNKQSLRQRSNEEQKQRRAIVAKHLFDLHKAICDHIGNKTAAEFECFDELFATSRAVWRAFENTEQAEPPEACWFKNSPETEWKGDPDYYIPRDSDNEDSLVPLLENCTAQLVGFRFMNLKEESFEKGIGPIPQKLLDATAEHTQQSIFVCTDCGYESQVEFGLIDFAPHTCPRKDDADPAEGDDVDTLCAKQIFNDMHPKDAYGQRLIKMKFFIQVLVRIVKLEKQMIELNAQHLAWVQANNAV